MGSQEQVLEPYVLFTQLKQGLRFLKQGQAALQGGGGRSQGKKAGLQTIGVYRFVVAKYFPLSGRGKNIDEGFLVWDLRGHRDLFFCQT